MWISMIYLSVNTQITIYDCLGAMLHHRASRRHGISHLMSNIEHIEILIAVASLLDAKDSERT